MRYFTVFIWLLSTATLSAQPFNSIKKIHSLAHVSIQQNTEEENQHKGATIREYRLDTITQTPPTDTATKVVEGKAHPSIVFSKPLISLNKTSSYGNRFHPILKKWRFHSGVDFASHADTVYSMLSGHVKESGYSSTLGYYVRTLHSGGKIEILYAHLSQYHYRAGQQIFAGEPLGITGSTGLSTGDHLHLAVYENGQHIDPISFMSKILLFNNKPQII